ncbi:MAG: urease accessory protein UreJ [Methylobacterium sp.]|nr:urease accessory protein UreJ [Methylobacterium sp.]
MGPSDGVFRRRLCSRGDGHAAPSLGTLAGRKTGRLLTETGTMTLRNRLTLAFTALLCSPALAHHPMGGSTPSTLTEGLLSGLGHPILGLDHLAALVAVGLVASRYASGALLLPVLWIAGMGLGAFAHMNSIDLPAGEILVAGSLVLIGAIGVLKPSLPLPVLAALFAAAGFAHGHALAESIIGADTAVVGAYLIGLVAIQAAVTVGTILLVRRLFSPESGLTLPVRAAAAAMGCIGLVFLIAALPATA